MKVASQKLGFGLLASTAIAFAGCAGTQMPRLESPGSAGSQRYSALQWDPYPLDDIAPPVAGGRPQEYARPIPEVKRGQTFTARPRNPAPVVMPSFAAPVSPVITAPPALPAAPAVSPFAPPPTVPYQQSFAPMPAAPPAAVPVYPGM
jgi:hypothetical protein